MFTSRWPFEPGLLKESLGLCRPRDTATRGGDHQRGVGIERADARNQRSVGTDAITQDLGHDHQMVALPVSDQTEQLRARRQQMHVPISRSLGSKGAAQVAEVLLWWLQNRDRDRHGAMLPLNVAILTISNGVEHHVESLGPGLLPCSPGP